MKNFKEYLLAYVEVRLANLEGVDDYVSKAALYNIKFTVQYMQTEEVILAYLAIYSDDAAKYKPYCERFELPYFESIQKNRERQSKIAKECLEYLKELNNEKKTSKETPAYTFRKVGSILD